MSSPDPVLGDVHVPGDPLPGASVESRSADMRRRRIPLWIGLMAGSVAAAVAISVRLVSEVGKPYIGASEITGGVVFLVASVGIALWMAWITPRVFTRQGVAADAVGVALIQEPNMWFAGRTVRIPWGLIESISEDVRFSGSTGDGHRRKRKTVTLMVDTEDRSITVPSWAGAQPLPAYEGAPPRLRVVIDPGNIWQSQVFRVLSEARPDLCT